MFSAPKTGAGWPRGQLLDTLHVQSHPLEEPFFPFFFSFCVCVCVCISLVDLNADQLGKKNKTGMSMLLMLM